LIKTLFEKSVIVITQLVFSGNTFVIFITEIKMHLVGT